MRVETQLVHVHMRVIGSDDKPVIGLKKSDFAVKENGRREQVEILDMFPSNPPFYELYTPPSYHFNAVAATRTALSRNGIPFRQFNINWRILPEPEKKAAILIGTLDTRNYQAGSYRVVQSVPPETSVRGKLFASFTLLPNQP